MGDLHGRKVFKVFNQDFVVDERYNVTKELGQGAYGIVWYVSVHVNQSSTPSSSTALVPKELGSQGLLEGRTG